VVAGFYLIFRKRYGLGAALTMLFTAIGFGNHPQMSYYLFMMIGLFFFAELYIHIKEKRYKDLAIGSLLFFGSLGIGLGTGSSTIFVNQEYAEQTMRGGHSDLKKSSDTENKTKGLDLDYATQWSYGIDESLSFIIPGVMGGASTYDVGTDSELYKSLVQHGVPRQSAAQFCANVPLYWGEQPFTDGNVYMESGKLILRDERDQLRAELSKGMHVVPFPFNPQFQHPDPVKVPLSNNLALIGRIVAEDILDSDEDEETLIDDISGIQIQDVDELDDIFIEEE
jgi:hypothetical protein